MAVFRQFRIVLRRRAAWAALRLMALAALALWALACAHGPRPAPPRMETPRAAAASMLAALGAQGSAADFKCLHYIYTLGEGRQSRAQRETWVKRATGDCRLETGGDGRSPKIIATFNPGKNKGVVYQGQRPVPVEDQPGWLKRVFDWQRGDAFWLLAATRIKAPGARCAVSGAQMINGVACPTLAVAYGPGEAPPQFSQVWWHLDPKTSRPLAWSFARRAGDVPSTWLITDWATVGDVTLPARFKELRGRREVAFEQVFAPGSISSRVLMQP